MTAPADRCTCGHERSDHNGFCRAFRPVGVGSTPPGFRPRTERCPCPGFLLWKEAGRVEAGALVACFLFCVVGLSLFALLLMGAAHGVCKVYKDRTDGPSYCVEGHVR